jgi:hypothetical protein
MGGVDVVGGWGVGCPRGLDSWNWDSTFWMIFLSK